PAPRPPGPPRPRLPLHRPRPQRRRARQPAHRRHVPRPHRRNRRSRAGHPLAPPPLHPRAPLRRARAAAGRAQGAHRAQRRRAQPGRATLRVPLPPPLPAPAEGRGLRRHHPAARREGTGPVRGMHQGAGVPGRLTTGVAPAGAHRAPAPASPRGLDSPGTPVYVGPHFFSCKSNIHSGWRAQRPRVQSLGGHLGQYWHLRTGAATDPGPGGTGSDLHRVVRPVLQGRRRAHVAAGAVRCRGLIVIVWKLIDLTSKGIRTSKVLREVDDLMGKRKITEAMAVARDSNTPAGRILVAGLERRDEGTDRVLKAIENVGLLEMAGLERGLVWLATVSNVAPLLGFLGTVMGMIEAFAAIEAAGEVEATLVAAGIKVALITTATGLAIAIPINIAHNYFVSK